MNRINIFSTEKKFKKEERKIKNLANKVLFFLKKNNLSVDFFLVSKKEIRRINKNFRKKDKETNVLSFEEPKNFIKPKNKFKKIGEVYLSPDFIKENNQDMNLMVIHGILHLLGYDHIKTKDRVKMEKIEKNLLSFV